MTEYNLIEPNVPKLYYHQRRHKISTTAPKWLMLVINTGVSDGHCDKQQIILFVLKIQFLWAVIITHKTSLECLRYMRKSSALTRFFFKKTDTNGTTFTKLSFGSWEEAALSLINTLERKQLFHWLTHLRESNSFTG